MNYVLGFAFNKKRDLVLLIEKLKPEWMKGLLNGIGGKIKSNESIHDAMNREAKEEANLSLDWFYKMKMYGNNNDGTKFECHIFYAYSNILHLFEQMENESIELYSSYDINSLKTVSNLQYLIPYGIYEDGSSFITIKY